jgi:hypothetical protein
MITLYITDKGWKKQDLDNQKLGTVLAVFNVSCHARKASGLSVRLMKSEAGE